MIYKILSYQTTPCLGAHDSGIKYGYKHSVPHAAPFLSHVGFFGWWGGGVKEKCKNLIRDCRTPMIYDVYRIGNGSPYTPPWVVVHPLKKAFENHQTLWTHSWNCFYHIHWLSLLARENWGNLSYCGLVLEKKCWGAKFQLFRTPDSPEAFISAIIEE